MPKRHHIIYCDESAKKGVHFSNFYGGALVKSEDREAIEMILNERKEELNLFKEIKWQYITENYKQKYISFINTYFDLISNDKIKIRIMFTHNQFKPTNLTPEQSDDEYFILYYYFIKHAFGLHYCNPGQLDRVFVSLLLDQVPSSAEKFSKFKEYIVKLNSTIDMKHAKVILQKDQIADVDSKNHVILQGLDIILGSMNFRLNDKHLEKPPNSKRRGKRTIAKEAVYKVMNKRIREIYPNFNIGVSTATIEGLHLRWVHKYRHWKFVPNSSERDTNFAPKNAKMEGSPT